MVKSMPHVAISPVELYLAPHIACSVMLPAAFSAASNVACAAKLQAACSVTPCSEASPLGCRPLTYVLSLYASLRVAL